MAMVEKPESIEIEKVTGISRNLLIDPDESLSDEEKKRIVSMEGPSGAIIADGLYRIPVWSASWICVSSLGSPFFF